MYLNARSHLGRDAAWLLGFVMILIREPWFRLRVMSVASRGLAPLGAGWGKVAWIWDGSYQGAHAPHRLSSKAN